MTQKISAPNEGDITRLAQQVIRVQQLCEFHLTQKMNEGGELEVLQKLLDTGSLKPADTYDLQCLGIVFGRCLCAAIEGLDWVMVEDEYGRDPGLQYSTSTLLLFPMTMISKRIEDGESVDVRDLLERTRESIQRLKSQVGWSS